ncbi:glutaminase [Ostreibacterium oceani]|uniref:Glutaminase n=1 Tax=Ostreibacterium oceani TaxID=2654998 RepID=A0A6N7EUM4_9GAMM|nr:glutaminase [Ostreibacterium oceani]MPV85129.1 glutaminase [Ostreibacterium oceani]
MVYSPLSDAVMQAYNTVFETPDSGLLATYIPKLATVDPNQLGVALTAVDGSQMTAGDSDKLFSIQSISKVLLLCFAYRQLDAKTWERVGVEPSGTAFNSLLQLESDAGIPRNPFINAGALVVCDLVLSLYPHADAQLLAFIQWLADDDTITYSPEIATSEKQVGHRNKALCYFLKSLGNLHNDPEVVLDFYFNLCSIEMSCNTLSRTFLFLANGGQHPTDNKQILTTSQAKRINAVMQTCGFYDESGEFAFRVGLPGKSGVGGGIVAVYPKRYAVAVWSPRLNEKGNSYRGMRFLETLTSLTGQSVF